MSVAIRDVLPADAEAICAIYNRHVRETTVTFEEIDISVEEMRGRIGSITTILPWLIAEQDGDLAGYAYAGRFFDRSGYRFCAMSAIYLDDKAQRRGIGYSLYAD